jgi:spermidine synthase
MMVNLMFRGLSWLWPIPVESLQGAFGPLQVRWEHGRKVLNSEHANQSFGSLHQVWARTFAAIGLAEHPPERVLLLGLGGGSVPHILRTELGLSPHITVVELDPVMVDIATRHFGLDPSGLRIELGDARVLIHAMKEHFDLVVVDLFDELDMVPGVETSGFMHALRDRCANGGVLCFNTIDHDAHSGRRCEKILSAAKRIFNEVREYRSLDVNRVFVAS